MKSKKRLAEDLRALGHNPIMGNEVYGRRAFMYLACIDPRIKDLLIKALADRGHKIDPGWPRQNKGIAVQVSYFKGWHWDE